VKQRIMVLMMIVVAVAVLVSGCGNSGGSGNISTAESIQSAVALNSNNTVTLGIDGLSMTSFTVATDQTVTVPVVLSSDDPFCGYSIDLTYNNAIVQLTDDNLVNTGASFGGMVVVNPENGKVIGITLTAQKGNVNIVNLNFKGVNAGETSIIITGTKVSCNDQSEAAVPSAKMLATTINQ
jgi:hypothetical protein